MAQVSVGKLLPNLKVTLGNDQIETDIDVKDTTVDCNVEIVRPSIEKLANPKIYKNKDGGFATGIDLIAEEKSGVLTKRAERFGLNVDEMKPSISALYESMGIDVKKRDSAKLNSVRLDAIHVRGLEELNTDQVFTYFQDYGPSSIEWINDSSCNILWFDEFSCARALLGLSKPLPDSFNSEVLKSAKTCDPDISSLDLGEAMDKNKMDVDPDVNIPVPPGQWRIGIAHPDAETILLRFATRDDKKAPGAEKRSKFYKKYGNPNYGGMKGLISKSRKLKQQQIANRWNVSKESSFSSHQSSDIVKPKSSKKVMRMRMYADDEELKTKKIRSKDYFAQNKSNVHSRLGVKYTSQELCQLGNYKKFYEDDTNYNSKSSSLDLRKKLKNIRNESYREDYSQQNNESVKQYRRVDDLKKERRTFYKRKHRSPLCEDDDDDDDDSQETSSSQE